MRVVPLLLGPEPQIVRLIPPPVTCSRCARTAEEAGELQIAVFDKGEGFCSEGYSCERCQASLTLKACSHCERLIAPGVLAYIEDAAPGYHVCEDCEYGPPSVALAAAARVEAFRALQAGEVE